MWGWRCRTPSPVPGTWWRSRPPASSSVRRPLPSGCRRHPQHRPDHLDWHPDLSAYAAAKARIHENQDPDDLVAHPVDDPAAMAAVAGARSRRVPVSGTRRPPGGNGPERGRLHVEDLVLPLPDLDPVWRYDLTVAATLARSQGATGDAISGVIDGFRPGPHRRRVVAVRNGVTWVDDSKATNPHAAVAAAGAYRSVVLIAGGRNKGLDLAPLAAVPWCTGSSPSARPPASWPPQAATWSPRSPTWPRRCRWQRRAPHPATPCCSPRGAPASTCSTRTPTVATCSPPWSRRSTGGRRGRAVSGRAPPTPRRTVPAGCVDSAATVLRRPQERRAVMLAIPVAVLVVIGLGAVLSSSSVIAIREGSTSTRSSRSSCCSSPSGSGR